MDSRFKWTYRAHAREPYVTKTVDMTMAPPPLCRQPVVLAIPWMRLNHRMFSRTSLKTSPSARGYRDAPCARGGGVHGEYWYVFLRTRGHVTKFRSMKILSRYLGNAQRAWVVAWRFWAVTWVTDSLPFTIPTHVSRPHDSTFVSLPEAAWSLSLVTWVNGQTKLGAG